MLFGRFRVQKWSLNFSTITPFLFSLIFLLHFSGFAAPSSLTYQGRILKSDGTGLEYSNVSFIFQITDPTGLCVIYQEQANGFNMSNSGGVFDIPIGLGTIQYPLSGTATVLDAFNNSSTFTCGSCSSSGGTYSCANGSSTYTPAFDDIRKLRVSFYDGTGWKLITPDNTIRTVPFAAYSMSAQKLGTNIASDFLLKAGLPTCGAGTFLTWNGTALSCGSVSGASGGTVTDVTSTNSYLSVATGTSTPALTLNVGTAAGTVAAGNDSRITGAMQSGASAGGALSGTYPNPGLSNNSVTSAAITDASITTQKIFTNPGVNRLVGTDSSTGSTLTAVSCGANQLLTWSVALGWQCTNQSSLVAGSAALATNFSGSLVGDVTGTQGATIVSKIGGYTLDLSAAPTSNQVLTWDGIKWLAASLPAGNAGTVTGVTAAATAGNPITIGGTAAAPTVDIPVATSSISGYLSSADWTTFNNKQASGSYITALTGDVTAAGPGSAAATIANNAVTTAKINDGAVTTVKALTTNPGINRMVATDGTTGATLSKMECSTVGHILSWTAGTGFQCNAISSLYTAPVTSVAGKTGAVTLASADISDATDANTASMLVKRDASGNFSTGTMTGTNVVTGALQVTGGTPAAGKVLTSDASGIATWQALSASQWTTTGSNIYYNTGRVGIGTSSPSASLHIVGPNNAAGTAISPLTVVGGNATSDSGNGGSVSLTGGKGFTYGVGGSVTLTGGGNLGAYGGYGGVINLGGTDSNGTGGAVSITGGTSNNGAVGGTLTLAGGTSSGTGGIITLYGGTYSPNNGGNVSIQGGAKSGGTADGNVLLAQSRGFVGIGTASPTALLHSVAGGAKTTAYTGNYLSSTATSSTASIAKIGLDVQSTGTWNGASATNTGLNVNVSGGTTNYAAIFSGGNVGIGTTAPGAKLDVTDAGTTTSAIIVPRAGAFTGTTVNGMIRYNSTSNLFEFYENGAWVNYTTVSDARLKTNVLTVTPAKGLDIVNQLNPVFYDWDKSNPRTEAFGTKHQVGFIAQEVEKVLPEVVNVGADNYRSVEYGKIVSVVVAAIKELYGKFLEHDEQLETQARQTEALKAENAILKARAEKSEEENKEIKARLKRIEKMLQTK